MKRLIPFLAIFILVIWACEELEEQDTPVCRECYQLVYDKTTNDLLDTVWPYETKKLCGGDIPNFQTLPDIVTDSTITKHKCD